MDTPVVALLRIKCCVLDFSCMGRVLLEHSQDSLRGVCNDLAVLSEDVGVRDRPLELRLLYDLPHPILHRGSAGQKLGDFGKGVVLDLPRLLIFGNNRR